MVEAASSDQNPGNSNGGRCDGDDDDDFRGPRPTVDEVLACQFSKWYPTFSKILPLETYGDNENQVTTQTKRKSVTIPSVIIEDLPVPGFKNYLSSDGVRLPKEATKLSSCAGVSNISHDDDDDNADGDGDDSDTFSFPGLTQRIQETIQDRFPSSDGILPKLNWSAPRDATWMNEGTMRCKTPGDVYLLLKSSDFCTHDVLYESLQDCRDYVTRVDVSDSSEYHPPLQLVLRKWCNLNPSMEFRCFVRDHELLGISQRQHSVHFPHLNDDKDKLYELIYEFFEDYVRHRFAGGNVRNYVWDVFVDKKDRAWIIDFNPWGRTTDSLLYEWSELVSTDLDDARDYDAESGMRVATSGREVRHDPLASYRAPIDTVDLASMTHGDAKQFEEFMKLCQRPTYWEENSDDDDDS
mmetsp:Transcript_18316/g.42192  ORF Transcript_18316/g.42192 Transcript_18316/m.42192 type:complete len:410 (+) Transcript_18316:55-1284(+)